jgi:hypothetical protein
MACNHPFKNKLAIPIATLLPHVKHKALELMAVVINPILDFLYGIKLIAPTATLNRKPNHGHFLSLYSPILRYSFSPSSTFSHSCGPKIKFLSPNLTSIDPSGQVAIHSPIDPLGRFGKDGPMYLVFIFTTPVKKKKRLTLYLIQKKVYLSFQAWRDVSGFRLLYR